MINKQQSMMNTGTLIGALDEFFVGKAGLLFDVFLRITTYTGYCLRVERGSDNTFIDVGFDTTGYLDIAAIVTFCTGTIGKVIRKYSQAPTNPTGFIGYLSQPYVTAPKIYDIALLVNSLGIVRLEFIGANSTRLLGAFSSLDISSITMFNVSENGDEYEMGFRHSSNQRYLCIGRKPDGRSVFISRISSGDSNLIVTVSSFGTGVSIFAMKAISGVSLQEWNNGVSKYSNSIATLFTSANEYSIANLNAVPEIYRDVDMSASIAIVDAVSDVDIVTITSRINERYGAYVM